jgi:hypothetical protein
VKAREKTVGSPFGGFQNRDSGDNLQDPQFAYYDGSRPLGNEPLTHFVMPITSTLMGPSNRVTPVVRIRRIVIGSFIVLGLLVLSYFAWHPGLQITDGRHDLGSNGIWISHGWLGADTWFKVNHKTNEFDRYRAADQIRSLAEKLRRHHTTDVFPHLCPAEESGRLPPVDPEQVGRFLDAFQGFRVLPWIGGPNGTSARISDPKWRNVFTTQARQLLEAHSRFAGVHINIEPLTSGDRDFLLLLEEMREQLPQGKILSVAAYPPPTRWHPFPEVHWEEAYFREVAKRSDQLAVMMYDAAQKLPKAYQKLTADWTREVLSWSAPTPVLLGVPTYDDAGVDYHDPKVENLTNALLGVHRGLSRQGAGTGYQGIALYCEWETSDSEWNYLQSHFLKSRP